MTEPSKRKFFLNIIQVEVLSEDTPISDGTSLKDIEYEFTEGHLVAGDIEMNRIEISPKEAADRCRRFGSTPDFFQINDDGEDE